MVMVLEQVMVDEIARIGNDRKPCEAAGVLLPIPWRGQQIFELPNRSKTPHDHFEMHGEDLQLLLGDFVNEYPEQIDDITIWHTHPGGNLGPSKYDLDNRIPGAKHLVVNLPSEGQPQATWY